MIPAIGDSSPLTPVPQFMIRAVWVFRHLHIYHPRPAVLKVSGAWSVVKALSGDDNILGNLKYSVIQALGDEELRQFLVKLDANHLGLLARNTVCQVSPYPAYA